LTVTVKREQKNIYWREDTANISKKES